MARYQNELVIHFCRRWWLNWCWIWFIWSGSVFCYCVDDTSPVDMVHMLRYHRFYFINRYGLLYSFFSCLFAWCPFEIGKKMDGSVVSMGGCSLALTMVLYLTEALYFRSSTLTFYVIFPCVLNCKCFDLSTIRWTIWKFHLRK